MLRPFLAEAQGGKRLVQGSTAGGDKAGLEPSCLLFLFFSFNFLATQHGTWDLNSPTRVRTCATCIGSMES